MKNTLQFLTRPFSLFIVLTLAITACGLNDDDVTTPQIAGKGKEIIAARSANNFTGIELNTEADVYIQPGTETKVEVEAQDNLQPFILTYVSGNKLIVSSTGNIRPTGKIKVFVTLPLLEKVTVKDKGRIIGNGTFATDKLTATVEGTGRIDLDVEAQEVKTNLSGTGSIYLSGNTKQYTSKVSGAGSVDISSLLKATASL